MRGWTAAPMITSIRRLLGFRPQPPDDRVFIDQRSYYDGLERRREQVRLLGKGRERGWTIVLARPCHTVTDRIKHPMPSRLPRGVIREWLDGLNVTEIFVLSTAGIYAIR